MSDSYFKLVDGRVSEVLVLTFEDGVTLWRHGLSNEGVDGVSPAFSFRSWNGRRPTARYGDNEVVRLPDGRQILVFAPFLLTKSGGVERTQSPFRHLRTTFEYLGAIRRLQTPIPTGIDYCPEPTIQNPYIGVFSAQTEAEVLLSLDAVDDDLRTLSEGAVRAVVEPVFSNGTSLWVRRSRGLLEAMVRRRTVRWGGSEDGFVERGADLSHWAPFSSARDLYSWLSRCSPCACARACFCSQREPMHRRAWFVLPQTEALAWWLDQTVPFSSPLSSDEAEVFRLVGEDLPWLWPAKNFVVWAKERWL